MLSRTLIFQKAVYQIFKTFEKNGIGIKICGLKSLVEVSPLIKCPICCNFLVCASDHLFLRQDFASKIISMCLFVIFIL